MKVMIDGKPHDGKKELVCVYLTPQDKKNIAEMPSECRVYMEYPDELFTIEEAQIIIRTVKERFEKQEK